jgi:hypothetical protein
MKTIKLLVALALIPALVASCDSEKKEDSVKKDDQTEDTVSDTLSKDAQMLIDAMFNNIPSPLTLSFILRDAGITFVDKIPHNPEKVSGYVSREAMSVNLGIYGTDLTYSNIMGKSDEALRHMAASVHLHEALGIDEAVGTELISRMEKNQDNQDSMRSIISESFASLELYLKENEQMDVAGMMLTGGVVEALYIATQEVDLNSPDPKIAQLIADQKYSVKSLMELFSKYNEGPMLNYLKDIERIWSVYEQMPEEKMNQENSMEGDVLVIGAKQQIKITTENIAALKDIVTELRNRYINEQ